MITYIKLGKVRGLSLEVSKELGASPFFKKNTFHHETIIDIPYTQITFTSAKWTPYKKSVKSVRSVANGNQQNHEIKEGTG